MVASRPAQSTNSIAPSPTAPSCFFEARDRTGPQQPVRTRNCEPNHPGSCGKGISGTRGRTIPRTLTLSSYAYSPDAVGKESPYWSPAMVRTRSTQVTVTPTRSLYSKSKPSTHGLPTALNRQREPRKPSHTPFHTQNHTLTRNRPP